MWGTRSTLAPPTDSGAGCGIRTHKPFRAVVFETTAYAVPPTRLEPRIRYRILVREPPLGILY
jgi:hypothetical protein